MKNIYENRTHVKQCYPIKYVSKYFSTGVFHSAVQPIPTSQAVVSPDRKLRYEGPERNHCESPFASLIESPSSAREEYINFDLR